MLYRLSQIFDWLIFTAAVIIMVSADSPRLTGEADRVRRFTRHIEFDYIEWSAEAFSLKLQQSATGVPYTFERSDNKRIVFRYLRVTQQAMQTEQRIEQLFADPSIKDKENAIAHLREQRDTLLARQRSLAPLAEAALQQQLSEALFGLGLTSGGQPLPPVLYHSSPVPMALIVSPRDHIEQTANISILPDITVDQQVKLEDQVAQLLDVSTLVVPVGGVGVYPTMVMQTTDLRWMLDTIAHEWTHNYLSLRPLGINYSTTPELRTMNETTASIAGNEVGHLVLEKFYPEVLASSPSQSLISFNQEMFYPGRLGDTQSFDFRAEMHETRVTTDKLLAEGKIDEAEVYMEQRRQFIWQNGYFIRKLNQAYFAFHGAYADVPGGAAGEDPVGPAVRALRERSPSLAAFINRIAWMTSFEQLQHAISP